MTQRIDYFFGLGSPWAYVGFETFSTLVRDTGASVVPHVIGLIEENGGIYSRNRPEARRAYWTTDLKRWAARRGVPLEFGGRDRLAPFAPAEDVIIAAALAGQDWLALAGAYHTAFWGRAEDVGTAEVRSRITTEAGFDSPALEAAATGPEIARFRAESTDLARTSGVFGIPSYLVGDQLFWGQDSLGFLESHLKGERLTA